MSDNKSAGSPNDLKTSGVGSFGGEEEPGLPRLFHVAAGYSADLALMHSSQLMACVHKLTLEAGTGQEGDLVWAAHYLSGMAKALVEDVAHSITMSRR